MMPHLIAVIFSSLPAALAVAGGVAAAPIIIHLLNRKRYQIIAWAAMRFLLVAQRRNVRRLRLEQWTLLAVRMLIGILIVAAMCSVTDWAEEHWRQIVPGGAARVQQHGRTHRIIVIDGCFSMATRINDGTRFDLAKEQAKLVLDRAGPGDGFTLILLASTAQAIVQGPVDDRNKVAEEIDELELPHGSADVSGGLRMAIETAIHTPSKYGRREVIFITDLKKSSWSMAPVNQAAEPEMQSSSAASLLELTKAADVVFIDVARQDVDNVSVSHLALGDPLPMVNANTTASTVITNHGRSDLAEVNVELRIGQAPKASERLVLRPVGVQPIALKAGTSATVTFKLENQNSFREAGEYILQVKIGDDSLRLDDTRSLAVTVRETIPVLVVNGKLSPEPLDTPGEWVRRALRPGMGDSPVLPTLIPAAQFADRFRADLTKYDCVFLCDLPSVSNGEAERLEAHLRRGGSVVISLGPNVAQNIELYNRVLFNEGKGILPGKLLGVKKAEEKEYFTLVAEEEAFKQPPLNAYRDDRERAALTLPQFHQYVRLNVPHEGLARRIFSFMPSNGGKIDAAVGKRSASLDPAIVDYPRHHGRVIVYTSTFNPERIGRDQFWSTWPPHATFLPFLHETLRYLVSGGNRRNLTAGDTLEEYLPVALSGLKATLIRGEGTAETELEAADIVTRDEAAVVQFSKTEQSGIYRVSAGKGPDSLFALNVPVTAPGGGAESDLRRLTLGDLHAAAPQADVQLVAHAEEIKAGGSASRILGETSSTESPDKHGAAIARLLLLVALILMFAEAILAWHYGSSRASTINAVQTAPTPRRGLVLTAWLFPTIFGFIVLGTWIHAIATDDFLGFLPSSWRQSIERSFDVAEAAPGENTRWRLKTLPYLTGSWKADRWLVGGLALLSMAFVGFVYSRERIGYALALPHRFLRDPRLPLALLRVQLLFITELVLLTQTQLIFEREAWPDVVFIFDDSRSMATVEVFRDPVLREKTEELKAAWAEIAWPRIEKAKGRIREIHAALQSLPSPDAKVLRNELTRLEKQLDDLRTPHRLNLIKALLASGSQDWLQTLLRDRKMHVHLYRASADVTRIADLTDPSQCARMLEEIIDIVPEGEASRLGDILDSVLKTFRGKTLNAIVMFTDGQTTKGEEPSQAAVRAKRKKVPLFFVGVGDSTPRPDIIVGDLKAEREINIKDRLVFDVRVTAQGPGLPDSVPVHLYEIVDGKPVRRDTQTANFGDKPIRLSHVPETPGDKLYVVEVPVQEGEFDARNNRVEHEVHVAQAKRVRVLLIENAPRYEFRFIKTLFERETEQVLGNKSIELNVWLTGANRDFFKEDKSAIADFPGWEVLKTYDVIILGDVDPKQFPREQAQVKLIADFVKERGGGLLVIAGAHFMPYAYAGTDLADVLPVTTDGVAPPPAPKSDDASLTTFYMPRLTTIGQNHPIFRFVGEEAANEALWNQLKPMYWYAKGYRRKLSAEVLAVHPSTAAEAGPSTGRDELHPLVLQQFVGAGRVMFFGFDETWRWRFRQDEPRFNQFWMQTVRSLARTRAGRIEVSVAEKTFRRDDPIRITVRFPDDAPAPSPKEVVRVNVERRPLRQPGQEVFVAEPEIQSIQLAPKEKSRGTFEALLTRTPEGEYRFVLAAPQVTGREPKAEATVLPPKGELDDTSLNDVDIRKAARETSGEYYTLDKAEDLLWKLPDPTRLALNQPRDPLPMWNHALMFALVFALLLSEWLLRKRARLL